MSIVARRGHDGRERFGSRQTGAAFYRWRRGFGGQPTFN